MLDSNRDAQGRRKLGSSGPVLTLFDLMMVIRPNGLVYRVTTGAGLAAHARSTAWVIDWPRLLPSIRDQVAGLDGAGFGASLGSAETTF